MDAAQYLRKSRMEEGLDTDEVLSRHRKALAEYAAAHDIHIIETYYEVVSGESLYARPEMLRLLEDVDEGRYEAVLVMDLDRLSRGRMKDQGIILDTFKDSGTLIITPEKTYDLSDDLDEEVAELKTFISRREYKIINKRLRRGLAQSIAEGCYVANAPYGYRNVYVDRKPTLEIIEDEAKYVHMMYDMYLQGYGCMTIARHITALGSRPHRAQEWGRTAVRNILRNPTYTGKVVWNQKKHIRKGAKGNPKHITIYQPREKWTITDGLHPAIITREQYEQVQRVMDGKECVAHNDGTVKSPLAGLVYCSNCGGHMQRMAYAKGGPYLLCTRPGCCGSTKFDLVEARVLLALQEELSRLNMSQVSGQRLDTSVMETSLAAVHKDLAAAAGQKNRLYELLELGEYDIPTFRERMGKVKEKIAALERREAELTRSIAEAQNADPAAMAAKIQAVLDAYDDSDAARRNALLKQVLHAVWYTKEKKSKPHAFTIRLDLRPF